MCHVKITKDGGQYRREIEVLNSTLPSRGDFAVKLLQFHDSGVKRVTLGNQDSTFAKESLARIFERGNGVAMERQCPAHVGDDDVRSFRQVDLPGIRLNEFDAISEVVRRCKLPA